MGQNMHIREGYFGDELTRHGFISHMQAYIKQLLINPKEAHVDDYLESHGITTEKALEILLKKIDKADEESSVLIRKEQIKTGDDGKDIFCVTYKLPRKDYKKKMRNLYISNFESNIIEGCPINEDYDYERILMSTPNCFKNAEKVISQCKPGSTGDRFASYVNENNYNPHMFANEEQMVKEIEDMDKDNAYKNRGGLNKKVNECDCAGCMQGGGGNPDAGQYVKPMGKVQRRVFLTQEQFDYLKEATTTSSVGAGDGIAAPMGGSVNQGSKDPFYATANNHKNICSDPNLRDGGVTRMNEGKKQGWRKKDAK